VYLHRLRADVRTGRVAGYLFRPLAEAVVFALIASYVLSRTLVPTLANYLLRKQAHAAHHDADGNPDSSPAKPAAIPWSDSNRGFERRFEGIRSFYGGLLVSVCTTAPS